MNAPVVYTVLRWNAADRLDDILDMIHGAFAGLEPPSGVLSETVADVAARQRDGMILVARSGDAFIGSLFCAPKDRALYLTRLAVSQESRKSGVARALLTAAEEEARRIGMQRLSLRVRVSLPGNFVYFSRAGFVETGRGQDPGRPPYIAMERKLIPAG